MYVYEWLPGVKSYNQGYYSPAMIMKRIRHVIMAPVGAYLTPDDVAALATTLQNKVLLADKYARWQILSGIKSWEPDNSNAQTLDFGDGSSVEAYGSQYGMTFTFGDRDPFRQIIRQKFNGEGANWCTFLVDEDFTIWCTQGQDPTNNKVVTGFQLQDYLARNNAMDAGSGVAQQVRMAWSDAAEFNSRLCAIPSTTNPNNIRNVADVSVELIAGPTANVVSLAFMGASSITNMNLAERYATILAANPSLLIAKNRGTGASVAVSGAVAVKIGGQSAITYTLSATNYPTSGGNLELSLTTPALLSAAGIKYFESPVSLVVPIP